ncbi:protein of unknown function, partial [Agrococcus baldri]
EHTGALVPIETVGRLACDSTIHHAVVNGVDQVLNLGRTERLFNRAQRRALAARDKGCRVPGCGMPASWCEAHHINPWDDGGPTDIDWGILVCVYHHHEIHAGRLRIEAAGPEPGNWRIIPQLRPADRYARTSRNGDASAPSSAGSVAAAAIPALAIKLPDDAFDAEISPPTPVTRAPPPHGRATGSATATTTESATARHRGATGTAWCRTTAPRTLRPSVHSARPTDRARSRAGSPHRDAAVTRPLRRHRPVVTAR